MEKDKFDIQRMIARLTADKTDPAGGEIQDQIFMAFCLITFGVFLTFTGLIGLVTRLASFARFHCLSALRPRMRPSLRRKQIVKLP